MTNPAKAAARRLGVRRINIASVRMGCERKAMARLPARPNPDTCDRPRILAYHAVGTTEWSFNDVSPRRFEEHLLAALNHGYHFVDPDLIARGEGQPKQLALTFDDGLRSVVEKAGPILHSLGIPWKVFVVSRWSDRKGGFGDLILNWREVEEVAKFGGTVGSHSASHPNFGGLSQEQSLLELSESRETIRSRTGIDCTTFAIPYGQSGDWSPAAERAAAQAGYEVVYAQAETSAPRGTVPRTKVSKWDDEKTFLAALRGRFDRWEEWY